MNLQTIKNNLVLASSTNEAIQFIRNNKSELEDYFVSLTDDEIVENKWDLETVCLSFINSSIFQKNKSNNEFIEIVTLFAELFEKIGFYGAISLVKANLPSSSSIRHRLNAVYHYSKVSKIEDYITKFDIILQSLEKAQDFAEVDYTGQVVQDTINYYLTAKKVFEEHKLDEKLGDFKTLFNSPNSKQNYKFLNHPTLKEYLDGYITEKIFIELIKEKVYVPSSLTQTIFQDLILNPINEAKYLTRYSSSEIRADVLDYGKANFTESYKDLSAYDRVQLYCYFNMRKHFFTTYAVYEKIYTSLNSTIFQKNKKIVFIDFGCGALTSGLAVASLYHDKENEPITMHYIGIDIADSMLEKAKEFSETELFNSESKFDFFTSWESISDELIQIITEKESVVVFNASYLFASSSLDEKSLSNFVNSITQKLNRNSYFVFQNPDRADRNEKYKGFKQQISSSVVESKTQRIYYKTKANSTFEPSNEVVNFEILSL